MKKKTSLKLSKQALIGIILISILSVGTLGAYVLHYMITRPGSITIGLNPYNIKTFEDEALTTEIFTLTFPNNLEYSEYGNNLAYALAYINATNRGTGETVWIMFNSSDLDPELSIYGEWLDTVTPAWVTFQQNEYIAINDTHPTLKTCFVIDYSQSTEGTTHTFNINIHASEETP